MPAPIVLVPRGDNLDAVTAGTRAAVDRELVGLGYVLQVWTWRNGEAVVMRRQRTIHGPGEPVVILRRGLRRGAPTTLLVDSIASALRALGLPYRKPNRSSPPPPTERALRRRRLLPGIHARGNRWRTLRIARAA